MNIGFLVCGQDVKVPTNVTSSLLEFPGRGGTAHCLRGRGGWGPVRLSHTGRPRQRMRAFFTTKGLVSLVRGVWVDGHQEFNIIRVKPLNGNAIAINSACRLRLGMRWQEWGDATVQTLFVWSEFC